MCGWLLGGYPLLVGEVGRHFDRVRRVYIILDFGVDSRIDDMGVALSTLDITKENIGSLPGTGVESDTRALRCIRDLELTFAIASSRATIDFHDDTVSSGRGSLGIRCKPHGSFCIPYCSLQEHFFRPRIHIVELIFQLVICLGG